MSGRRKQEQQRAISTDAKRAAATSASHNDTAPAGRGLMLFLSVVVLAASAWMLFFHLDVYCFWGDEVDTVLLGRGIARTGDTSAVIDHNVYAFGNGACLKDLHGRYQPPVANYLVAPFVGSTGTGTLWPRIPFATCGLLTVALLLYWMWQAQLSAAYWITFSVALLGNVSFYLFGRQCRYNAISTLLAVTIAWLYFHWRGQHWKLAALVIASILLYGTSYLAYAALYAALACDYLLFMRHRRPFTLRQMAWLLAPQVVVGLFIFSIYNPYASTLVPEAAPGSNLLADHLRIVWHFFRDLNNSELCIGLIVLTAPVLYFWSRNLWLLRGAAAIFVYTLTIAIFQPFPLHSSFMASVRYLSDEIPLCIAVSSLVIVTLTGNRWQFAAPLAVVVFGSTALNFPLSPGQWRWRPYDFVQEICNPRETAMRRSAQWINEHVTAGQSIWVLPDEMRYPLMYHAPHPIYAWQLRYPPEKQFEKLPRIHFIGQELPDYLLMFGPEKIKALNLIESLQASGIEYQLVEALDIFWSDEIRPEIFWRSFYPKTDFSRKWEAVYVYQRKK